MVPITPTLLSRYCPFGHICFAAMFVSNCSKMDLIRGFTEVLGPLLVSACIIVTLPHDQVYFILLFYQFFSYSLILVNISC